MRKSKAIATIISVIMLFSSTTFSFAANQYSNAAYFGSIEGKLNDKGFSIDNDSTARAMFITGEEKIIIADTKTELNNLVVKDEGILTNQNGDTFIEICDNIFAEATYSSVNLNDKNAVEQYIKSQDLDEEEIDEIIEFSTIVQNIGIEDATLTSYTTSKGFTYGGYEMKTKLQTYENVSTPTVNIYNGKTTKNKAKVMTDFALTAIGFIDEEVVSKAIPYIGAGVTVFDYFLQKYKESLVPGSTSDFVEMNMKFNRYDKRVFVKDAGQWHHVLDAEYIKILETKTRQYYYNKGKNKGYERTKTRTPNTVLKTPSYNSPYANALKAFKSHFFNEYITYKVGSKTFTFGV